MSQEALSSSGSEQWRLTLSGLRPDNIDEIYSREFLRWRVFHSDKRFINGEIVTDDDLALIFMSSSLVGIEEQKIEINDEREGFPLTEKQFIKESINKYEYIYNETEGSVINSIVNQRCELFLERLKNKLNILKDNSKEINVKAADVTGGGVIYFPKTSRINGEFYKLGVEKTGQLYDVENIQRKLNETFDSEYQDYINNRKYFPGCPLQIYMETYAERFKNYQIIYPDADEFDFLKYEDGIISRLVEMDGENKENFYSFFSGISSEPHQKKLKMSIQKIRDEFIDKRITELGHFFFVTGVDPIDYDRVPRNLFELKRNPKAVPGTENPKFFQYRKPTLKSIPFHPSKSKTFATVWEAVLFYSVLVDVDRKKYFRTKKDIIDIMGNWLKPNGKNISPNTFYQKLQLITSAKKGSRDHKHGKYTHKDYIAVEKRLLKEKPEAVSILQKEYLYNDLY